MANRKQLQATTYRVIKGAFWLLGVAAVLGGLYLAISAFQRGDIRGAFSGVALGLVGYLMLRYVLVSA